MEEMQVYVANLGKYNEGELVGDWFSFPLDYDQIAERIGLNDEYEEYAIHDYEMPIPVHEYTSIDELNRIVEQIESIDDDDIISELSELLNYWFESIDDLVEHLNDLIHYSDCDSMEEVAQYYIEETGAFGEIPSQLQNYIDYEALGRDMDMEGNFLETSHGMFEYIG